MSEFVSANPTGPMHMGNARGGALGDCLAAVLDWSGYDVTREFYINDAGNQIQKFGKSLAVRCLQLFCGEEAYPLPAECYQGGDIKVLAGEFAEINGDKYVAACSGLDEEALFASEAFETLKNALVDYALPKNIAALKRDLGKYRIDYDVWFHESTLHESGAVLDVVNKLLELGACYKAEDGAIMYRSAQYAAKYGTVNKKKTEDGTEEEAKDEVLVRANGIPTYFAADIAYHYNKLATRGFAKAIDVWGADHHGHVARMKGAMDAIGLNGNDLDVVLMQMVNLMRDGQPVRMSKRTGNAITLTDCWRVPIDSARFLFNMHDAGSGYRLVRRRRDTTTTPTTTVRTYVRTYVRTTYRRTAVRPPTTYVTYERNGNGNGNGTGNGTVRYGTGTVRYGYGTGTVRTGNVTGRSVPNRFP